MAKSWNVVSTTPDADPASAPPAAPSKWNVVSTVRDPQAGDFVDTDQAPEGFYAVPAHLMEGADPNDKRFVLRKNFGVSDAVNALGDLPGVGFVAHSGKAIYDTAKKAVAGLVGGATGNADRIESIKNTGNVDMGTFGQNDPVMRGMGALMEGVSKLTAPIDEAVNNLPDGPRTAIHAAEEAIPDVVAIAGARLPLKGVGPTVGEAASAVKNAVTAPKAAYRAAAGVENDWFKAGLRTGGGHPIAREVAGESGQEALKHHNVEVGNAVAAREAGHNEGPMTYESLAQAREAPSSVYNRVARILPEGQLDDVAKTAIESAGAPAGGRMTKGSPQAQNQITELKAQLLDPERSFTGQQMVNELRGLRQEGYTNIASDDVSNQQLGKAQIAMARALEDHISRNIPKGGDVSLDQFTAARKELAKNWTVQAALRGSDVDLKAIGRVYRNDPTLLDGGLKMLGEFAEGEGKDVVAIPNRYDQPSALRDLSHVVNIHRPVQSTIQGIPGVGSSARRILTGSTDKAVEAARSAFPAGAPDRFDPIAGLRPPPGRVGLPGKEPPQQLGLGDLLQGAGKQPWESTDVGANPNTVAPERLGDFATVLSEGLEQPGAAGLSAGPMGAPQGRGIPFKLSPEVFGARPVQGGSPPMRPRITDDFGNLVDPEQDARPRIPLGDRLAQAAEPEVAPPQGRVERFGEQSALTGSEGRVKTTRTGEPTLGDLLNDLQDLVGSGVPEGAAMRTGSTRTGPSKPWLVDEDKPGNQRGFDNLMEDIHGEDPLANNASGQTDVSQEFANWQAERKAAGISRYRYDPSTEEMVPLHSTSARDPSSVKGRPVFDKTKDGEYTIIDRGGLSPSELKGIIARMKQAEK